MIGTGIRSRIRYRARQFFAALMPARPLTSEEREEVRAHLPGTAWPLFEAMSGADQLHSHRVWQRLGCSDDRAFAQALLLHDCGKAAAGVLVWHRVLLVLWRQFSPRTLHCQLGGSEPGRWPRGMWGLVHHAAISAELADRAGCEPEAVLMILNHHRSAAPDLPPNRLTQLMRFQAVDDAS